jgi:hypothetical protein
MEDKHWGLIAAFAFGAVFVSAILIISLFRPNPTPFEYTVFRIIIALAAAGIGAILPGFLVVKFKNWLRASGALALFIIVYFFAPAAAPLPEINLGTEPTTDAKSRAEAWLSLLDHNDYESAYFKMADGFKSKYPFNQFEEIVKGDRTRLGAMKTRQFTSSTPFESPPGASKGFYRQYVFRTSFEKEVRLVYEMVWLAAEKTDWRVSGIYTMVQNDAGQIVPY